jgi:outer membrane protein assembly factor BamB
VIADGKMYLFSEKGLAQVVDLTGKKGKLLHSAEFVDTILCTPAAANGALYVRSDEHLWKITEKK